MARSFAGRRSDLEAFGRFLSEADSGCRLVLVRGLGGIGKTTLTTALLDRFHDEKPGSHGLRLDAASLPAAPSRPDLLRVLARLEPAADRSSTKLFQVARQMEAVGKAIYTATAPPDVSDQEAEEWRHRRTLALEALRYTSNFLVQKAIPGSPPLPASAFDTMLSSAVRARQAIGTIASDLHHRGVLSGSDLDLVEDPTTAVSLAISDLLKRVPGRGEIAILIDNAESLGAHLHDLVEWFTDAETARPVVLIIAGRIAEVHRPDGSSLPVAEWVSALPLPTFDRELSPLDASDVEEFIAARHEELHGGFAPSVPEWVTQCVCQVTSGLPLWVATVVENLVQNEVSRWDEHEAANDLLQTARSGDELHNIIPRMFRGIVSDDSDLDLFTVLIAMAISPVRLSAEQLALVTGFDAGSVRNFLTQPHTFLRGGWLHDTARVVLREYVAASPDQWLTAATLAQGMLRFVAPEGDVRDANLASVADYLDALAWKDPQEAARKLLLVGAVWAWARPYACALLLYKFSWFLERLDVDTDVRGAITHLTKLIFPQLIHLAVQRGTASPDELETYEGATRQPVSVHASGSNIGSSLDHLRRLVGSWCEEDGDEELLTAARSGLDLFRLRWYVDNGVDDHAVSLATERAQELVTYAKRHSLERSVAACLHRLVRLRIQAHAPSFADDSVLAELTRLVDILLQVDTTPAAIALEELASTSMDRFAGIVQPRVDEVLERFELGSEDDFVSSLVRLLVMFGKEPKAVELLRATLRVRETAWITGWAHLIEAGLSGRMLDEVASDLGEGLRAVGELREDDLSDFGRRQRDRFMGLCRMMSIIFGNAEMSMGIESPATGRSYLWLWGHLLSGDRNSAGELLEELTHDHGAENYHLEAALLVGDSPDQARGELEKWARKPLGPYQDRLERGFLHYAAACGMIEEELALEAHALSGGSGLRPDGEEGAS